MDDVGYSSWAKLVEALFDQARRNYRDEYAKSVTIHDLFAWHVRRMRIACELHPEGIWLVTITILGRRGWDQEKYFARCQLVAGKWYVA